MKHIILLFCISLFYSCGTKENESSTGINKDSHRGSSQEFTIINDSQHIPAGSTKWTPTHSQITSAEKIISKIIKANPRVSTQLNGISLSNYYRQYVCYVQRRDSVIYLNALCNENNLKIGQPTDTATMRKTLVVMKDAGKCNWQLKFDYSKKQASFFALNGAVLSL